MPALSFSVFKDKILDGSKRQTIRAIRKRAIATGDKLFLYWKQQSPKDCKKLGETTCTKAIPVRIERSRAILTYPEVCDYEIVHLDKFAQDDGFDNWQQLVEFFENTHSLPFTGVLIQWNSIIKDPDPELVEALNDWSDRTDGNGSLQVQVQIC